MSTFVVALLAAMVLLGLSAGPCGDAFPTDHGVFNPSAHIDYANIEIR